jgi:hypothetical protein
VLDVEIEAQAAGDVNVERVGDDDSPRCAVVSADAASITSPGARGGILVITPAERVRLQ